MAVPVFLMLRFLGVRHLAVIDRLEVEFGPGLNVLTGETGAGKSILVNAMFQPEKPKRVVCCDTLSSDRSSV